MRAVNLALLLLALLWAAPAQALDWWVDDDDQARALGAALDQLWPEHSVVIRQGQPPATGDAVWMDDDTLMLRHDGSTRRAEKLGAASTQVVLVRSWLEAELTFPPPPPPPPAPPASLAPKPLHAPHLLPGAGAAVGAELAVATVATGSLATDPIEAAARGYAPVLAASAGVWRLRATATAWNLWEAERSHQPMGVAGLSVLVMDRERWRLAPWIGAAGGWKQTEADPSHEAATAFSSAAGMGFGGTMGAGIALEVSSERLTWDLSLPIAGLMRWQLAEDPDSAGDSASDSARRLALLLPYPEAGISWRLGPTDTMRFGLLASVPSVRWRHSWARAYTEISAATSVGLGQLGDGDLLLGGALQARMGVNL